MDPVEEFVTYTVHVHEEDDGSLWATVEQLPGCFASGFSEEELEESLIEAISLYLSAPESPVSVTVDKSFVADRERSERKKFLVSS